MTSTDAYRGAGIAPAEIGRHDRHLRGEVVETVDPRPLSPGQPFQLLPRQRHRRRPPGARSLISVRTYRQRSPQSSNQLRSAPAIDAALRMEQGREGADRGLLGRTRPRRARPPQTVASPRLHRARARAVSLRDAEHSLSTSCRPDHLKAPEFLAKAGGSGAFVLALAALRQQTSSNRSPVLDELAPGGAR
jgi:hypothetical protein